MIKLIVTMYCHIEDHHVWILQTETFHTLLESVELLYSQTPTLWGSMNE
uniref:Uncharacterized protein n=1 Tax=Anguilla anguilla TaxID=7936 RepID=A0A0E9PBY2_ANGAN